MTRHLTVDPARVDAIVDLSNVVRESALPGRGPADLGRLGAVVRALAEHLRDDDVLVHAVADDNLLTDARLTGAERRQLASWAAAGLLETRPDADPRLLELCRVLRVPVIGGDRFLDHYRTHPWIPGNRNRFLQPYADASGRVRLRPLVMPVPEEWQISRKQEESVLKAARLYDRRTGSGRADVLDRLWRCPVGDCVWFGADTVRPGQAVPLREDGAVVCPEHLAKLRDAGPRPACVQLKVLVDDVVRARFLVGAGQEVLVGRAPAGASACRLQPWLDAGTASWVSRTHVSLRLDRRDGLVVRDLSTNGTRVRVRDPRDGSAEEVWLRGAARRLRPRDVVVLHDRVVLERSGRTLAFDESPAPPSPPPRVPAPDATMIARPALPPSAGPRRRRRRR
jgi:hypothetical protein